VCLTKFKEEQFIQCRFVSAVNEHRGQRFTQNSRDYIWKRYVLQIGIDCCWITFSAGLFRRQGASLY